MATFTSHVDSIDCSRGQVAVSLSNLEGNIWDGGLSLFSDTGEVEQSVSFNVGAPIARFAGDGCVLVAGRDDGSVSLHAVSDLSKSEVIEAHSDSVSSISSSGTTIITAGWDGDINLWDLASGKALQSIECIEDAHHFPITEVAVAPPSLGSLFASVGVDGFLRLWDSRSLHEGCVQIHNLGRSLSCVAWDPHSLFVGTDGGSVLRCDTRYLSDQRHEFYTSTLPVHGARVRRLHVLPGALLSVSDDGCLALSTTTEWSDTDQPMEVRTRLPLHSDYITDLAVVRDHGDQSFSLFTASTDKTIRRTTYNPKGPTPFTPFSFTKHI
ncbi:WD40-repeat-containing domain protein [Ochromonadaceae sp. CCMP2298]|nr:WD40-repeat-containing domain protein [Ochromonadaceae sp. CCMP2298]|eukprot:CAMPEP_0173239892 /NCGR_PEP_ID=MMETSP1142-20121109/13464_1 /TAXON_ID=483371 /ORGANISM="non described non described, Strain CCMP2298" /LENGTH=324 /DNA_ID=CAMNT_0014170955 /DNA_START=68 /DNA_END=1042 /DNA_ORIENTATION=-